MRKILFFILGFVFCECMSCSSFYFHKQSLFVKKVSIYATSVSTYTFKPISREYFMKEYFPQSVEYEENGRKYQGDGMLKHIICSSRKDSLYQAIKLLPLIGYLDSVEINDATRENVRILCKIQTNQKLINIWINHKARSCIIGDSVYLCSPKLIHQLCILVPETYICAFKFR